ncbi:MAG: ABC transporter ATP-binding protein [Oscillospiraceae bacterium]|jgi:ABC-2 type transport system ATP-binding protein|nr:ABC transporter ATP-binding protein [Oscillospiraceae bacterium]
MELEINRLTKSYGHKTAVDSFSAAFTDGIYALLGANGSGKTTLMRMVCGLLKPTAGEVLLDGTPISEAGESYRELLGYLPQNFGYYPNFTGWDFMMYLAALKGLPKFSAEERCAELLDLVGLHGERQRKLKTYSGGMLQRIGVAQSLINNPKILILDEPTAGLDPKERAKFRNIISGLSSGRIVILSTHIVSDVEYIADTVMIMKNGQLALQNSSAHICDAIDGCVWRCAVPDERVAEVSTRYVVSNLRHTESEVEMRIISAAKPFGNAVAVTPNLEDLYLYFFREAQAK